MDDKKDVMEMFKSLFTEEEYQIVKYIEEGLSEEEMLDQLMKKRC